ncbi:MAG: hypothetical protein E7068_00145 [Lentimicrobiaceae bacterium]|nr:hypothetical protein [Lentimicrobiaceae bacterium]
MKFKFLTLAVLAMLFTACKPEPDGGDETNPNSGDVEKSYISISLASSDGEKRGDDDNDGGYEEGEANERAVKTAYAFFFTDGQPFTNINSQTNYQLIDLTMTSENQLANVSDVSQEVLVISNYEGQLPNQLMVVLNWIPEKNTYTIDELRKSTFVNHMNNIEGTEYFIMSNSVYQSVAGDVYATPLDITDFYTTSDAAKTNPVTVYVERVAAKVRVTTLGDTDGGTDNTITKYQLKDNEGNPLTINGENIFAEIIGWDLYNDYEKSTLLKDIEGIGNDLGINWNDPNNFRSYWAKCNSLPEDDEIDYEGITSNIQNNLYCGENTRGNADADASERTKIFFKAQLQKEDGSPVEYAKWLGNEFIGKQTLLSAVKNTLAYTYYYGITEAGETTYKSIEVNDLMVVAGTGNAGEPAAYEVYFQINEEVNKDWFKLENNAFVPITKDALNVALKAIEPAILYSNGYTYYYTDIQHLKSATATTYGIVRNHIYEVNIKSITGLGTPVSDVTSEIKVPVTPTEEDIKTYLAAEINILSWKLITNDIDL